MKLRLIAAALIGWLSYSHAIDRPNILFIAVDDLRPELGCYGADHIVSPNIDRLAAEGVRFDHAYCQQAICGPSRASLMLGMRPDSTQIHGNHKHFRDFYPDLQTLPQFFKDHGYHTQSMGKIYHGVFPDGMANGPDTFGDPISWSAPTFRPGPRYYYTEEGVAIAKEAYKKKWNVKNPSPNEWTTKLVFGPMTEAPDVSDSTLYDGQVADRAIESLKTLSEKPDHPWFLAVGFIKPHTPFIAPKKYWDLYDPKEIELAPWQQFPEGAPAMAGHGSHEIRRYTDQPKKEPFTEANQRNLKHAYFACISYIDAQIGRVLDQLKASGTNDNTIVILWSDHGYHLGEQNLWGKTTNYELDTRVAFIVRAPGKSGNGNTSPALVELVDIYPTLVDLAGFESPEQLEGVSVAPLLDDPKRPWKSAAFSQYSKGKLRGYAMRTDQHRYVEWIDTANDTVAARELYDYSRDQLEKTNLAEENPELAAQLSKQLNLGQGWRTATPTKSTITLAAPFGDHMVLPRDVQFPIWGRAVPGSEVEVSFGKQSDKDVADAGGRWEVRLKPLKASREPLPLTIRSGRDSLKLEDVVVGDIWFAAGQSNMRWMVSQSDKAKEEIAAAAHPDLRLIDYTGRLYPNGKKYSLSHLRGTTEHSYYETEGWRRCSPETAANFSAVAYFFGEALQQDLEIPIGLVHNAVGGVPMETYLPPSAFQSSDELRVLPDNWLDNPTYPKWCRQRGRLNLSSWADAGGIYPVPGHPFAPSFLWKAGTEAWTQFPIAGVIWYQGESNATIDGGGGVAVDPAVNERKFRALIDGWRTAWTNPELPFLFAQLPGLNRDWELFREMQEKVNLETPNTGMAVTIDLGHPTNVHPTNKRPVGERLAGLALKQVYGKEEIVAEGPWITGWKWSKGRLHVKCDQPLASRTGDGLVSGFEVASNDRQFTPVTATISDSTGLTLPLNPVQASQGFAVRYAWANDPRDANLTNIENLPAAPWRSDGWEIPMASPGKDESNTGAFSAAKNAIYATSFEDQPKGEFTNVAIANARWTAQPGHAEINLQFAHSGKQCLRLFGGKDRTVEFELDSEAGPGVKLRFQAERWTVRAPFAFRVEAFDGAMWQSIFDGTDSLKVGARFLSDVQIPVPMKARKFRIVCTAAQGSGCLIDDLQITPAQKMKIVSVIAEAKVSPALTGKQENELLTVRVETEGNLEPKRVTGLRLIRGTGHQDGGERRTSWKATRVWFGGDAAGDGVRFGRELDSIERAGDLAGNVELKEGVNVFYISAELGQGATPDKWVGAGCKKIQIDGSWREVSPPGHVQINRRVGIALRQAGQDEVNTYRIPGLATTNAGTLIAVYDNRYRGRGDLPGDIDIGMSRSTNGGLTWKPMKVIMDMGDDPEWNYDGIGDPAVLVDEQTGAIWVTATWSHGNRSWNGSGPGLKTEETGQFMLTRSDDDGLTWSKPINITRQIKDPAWRFVLAGPGKGISMKDGTLVFPAQFRAAPGPPYDGKPFSTLIYSKDHGETWKIGTGAHVNTNEAQLVELGDGSIMINCRDLRGGSRSIFTTSNLGQIWKEHPSSKNALPEPVCQASLIRIEHEKHGPLLFFSNPARTRGRTHMTIKVSRDEGLTWPEELHTLVDERASAYSCLTRVGEDHIGLVYEGPRELYFVRYSIDELLKLNP